MIHPVILKDDKDMILVDCGYSDFLELIKKSAKNVNVDFLVEDKEIFDWCGGCEIIGTPTHMP